jgi:Uma2 family endonuclease
MGQHSTLVEPERIIVHTGPVIQMDDEQLFRFCQINRDLQIERDADGDITIMGPEGGISGKGGSKLNAAFENWAERDGTGEVFNSSTGFILPNDAMRSPDVAWVRNERLEALTDDQWKKFLPLCPDFVLELRSPSDSLRRLQRKMEEYCQNGAQLGWLIDPVSKCVHIYRPDAAPEILENPATLSGEPLLRGFVLDLAKIWAAMERRKQRS